MSTFTAVDLSKIPLPDVFEQRTFEEILRERLATFQQLMPEFDAVVESDPVYKLLQNGAYTELVLRAQFNQRAKGLFLATAERADLDNFAVPFGVARQLLEKGDPDKGTPDVYEGDTAFRRRIQLSPEGLSVAGPEGAYIFHTLGADSRVLDASAQSPEPDDIKDLVLQILARHNAGEALVQEMTTALEQATWPGTVVVSVLSRDGNGAATPEVVAAVDAALTSEDVRPLTDLVVVQSAQIVSYAVDADLYTFDGPDAQVVIAEARRRLAAYQAESHRLGRDVPRSAIYAQLHAEGVQRVVLRSPATDIVVDRTQAAFCESVAINHAGTDE